MKYANRIADAELLLQMQPARYLQLGDQFEMLGKNKIVPDVSPNKTWEGFLGGVGTTMVMAVLLHSFLTPFSIPFALFIGAMLAVTGFIGNITFSAIKRDLKIKDAGALILGHGGILDSIDSLSLSAPLFFHTVRYFYY